MVKKHGHVRADTVSILQLLRILGALFFVVGIASVGYFLLHPQNLNAGTAGGISGYGWSENVGWISFSCTDPGTCGSVNYGISVDNNGNLSGYAWGENIGWISANAADLAGCPSAPCTAKITGNHMRGWLKALSADGSGWDGWISLDGSNYGVTQSGNTLSGYAWGSDVVGWIDMSLARSSYVETVPACTMTLSQNTMLAGQYVTLSWTSVDSTGGTISPTVGTVGPSGSTQVSPTQTTTYTGTFNTTTGGTVQCTSPNATLTVTCAPIYSCSGQTIQYTNASCATSTVTTCAAPSFCSAGQSTCQQPPITVSSAGHLTAKPLLVRFASSTKVYWTVANVQSCTVSGNNGDRWAVDGNAGNNWTSSSGASGRTTLPIRTSVIYTLNCQALSGATPSTLTESITVVPTPEFKER